MRGEDVHGSESLSVDIVPVVKKGMLKVRRKQY
jgi:hypothetical protein